MIRVLVVDDSALVRKLFASVLSDNAGFEVKLARNGIEALQQIHDFLPDVVTLDIHMPGMDGLECLNRIMIERPCPVLMVSALTAEGADTTLKALELGAVDFVAKPRGAVSLHMPAFAPLLVDKIRAASTARIRNSARLRERVQHRIARFHTGTPPTPRLRLPTRASGEGAVLVGCSTGGPPALEALLAPLPETFRWPILVAQHMPASFTGALAKRLDRLAAIRVIEVRAPIALEPGHVYIGKGNADLVVGRRTDGLVAMSVTASSDYPWHPSMDRLVYSAMQHFEPAQLIAIIMTGMGSDGLKAVTELSARGGSAIAESEDTAVVWGMPGELIKAGCADWIEPLPQIGMRLAQLVPEYAAHT